MKKYLSVVIATVVALGIGFWSGAQYGKGNGANDAAWDRNMRDFQIEGKAPGQLGNGSVQQRGNSNIILGEITQMDDESIIVRLSAGGSKIVFVSDGTQIVRSVEGVLDDISVGETVTVSGTLNADGSLSAQSIQIRSEEERPPQG